MADDRGWPRHARRAKGQRSCSYTASCLCDVFPNRSMALLQADLTLRQKVPDSWGSTAYVPAPWIQASEHRQSIISEALFGAPASQLRGPGLARLHEIYLPTQPSASFIFPPWLLPNSQERSATVCPSHSLSRPPVVLFLFVVGAGPSGRRGRFLSFVSRTTTEAFLRSNDCFGSIYRIYN